MTFDFHGNASARQASVRLGRATRLEFYLSDVVTSFRATVEGVSAAGRPGHGEALIQSKLPISLLAKLPVAVSAGDRLELPVTLSNETGNRYTATLSADIGAAFKVRGKVLRRVTLAGGERKSFTGPSQCGSRSSRSDRAQISQLGAALPDTATGLDALHNGHQ